MANVLDFTKRKKEYLTVKLDDPKKTVLMIGTPTKSILEDFMYLNAKVEEEGGASGELVDDLYEICAKIMSFNKGGLKITSDYLSEFFDIEDIMVFFNAYMDYMNTLTNSKN